MNVATTEWRALTAEELRLLHIVGEMVGVAVERAQLYARSVEAGAANERNRLAREIHDTLAQGLSAIALQLEAAEEMLQAGQPPERVEARVSAALRVARTSLDDARRSVLDLRAAPLEGRSLAEALRELVSATREDGSGVGRVAFEAVGEAVPLPSRLEVGLYRIAQEALSNAARHSRASLVSVRFVAEPGRATLVIEDDGSGFDPAATVVGRFGLVGMRERARLLGGTLTVQSTIGAGTRIRAVIPLDDGASPDAPPPLP